MKIANKLLLAFSLLSIFLPQAEAEAVKDVTIDYRHGYRLRDRTHYDKLALGASLPDNWAFNVETKFKTGGPDPKDKYYNDVVLNVVEMTLLKTFSYGNWTLSPFIQPEFSSVRTEWKFGVAPWYKINDSWSIGGLYRLELSDYAHDGQCGEAGHDYCSLDKHRTVNRFDVYFRYRWDDLTTTYKYIYMHGDDKLFANKNSNYEQELQFNYALGANREWNPYVTFADIGRSAYSSERQLRLRLGVAYTFK